MIIIKNLIINYINNMNINDVNNFAVKHNIYLSESELLFIYNYIKKNYNELINNPNSFNFNNYKNNFSKDNFNKINILINEYKDKYII